MAAEHSSLLQRTDASETDFQKNVPHDLKFTVHETPAPDLSTYRIGDSRGGGDTMGAGDGREEGEGREARMEPGAASERRMEGGQGKPEEGRRKDRSVTNHISSGFQTKVEEFVTGQMPGYGVSSNKESSEGYSGEWPDNQIKT